LSVHRLDGSAPGEQVMNFTCIVWRLERIFELIAANVDQTRPQGDNWHQELLRQMAVGIELVRPHVISKETKNILDEYRGFRHVVRNVYSFHLSSAKISPLVNKLLAPLLEKQPEAQKPDKILCDMAYGTGKNREDMEDRQIKLICPVPNDNGRNGCFPKSAFKIDLETQTCQCPAGKLSAEKIYDRKTNQLKVFAFAPEQCQDCPFLNQCTKSKRGRRTVTVNQYEKYIQEARVFQKTEEFQNEYPERSKIERKQAEMVHHGLRQARYIGMAKVYLQSLLIGTIVNFKRYWKLINEKLTTGKEATGFNVIPIITTTPPPVITWGAVCPNAS